MFGYLLVGQRGEWPLQKAFSPETFPDQSTCVRIPGDSLDEFVLISRLSVY